MLDDGAVPAFLRLYEALVTLQKEIEQSLPEFTEMVLGLQKQDAAAALGTNASETSEDILSPNRASDVSSSLNAQKAKNKNSLALQRDAAQARKQLLANFANYDLIAKKIRGLDDAGNASLSRIKAAIWTKANLFLQQNVSVFSRKAW
jgi:rabenosyn-5